MILRNISKMLVVLADSTTHYASPKPGESCYIPDEAAKADCIISAINDGMVKIIKMGGAPAPSVTTSPIPARASKVEDLINKFGRREHEEDETTEGVVTPFRPEQGSDYTPPSDIPVQSKNQKARVEDVGQKLIKGRGRKKKLVPMVKTTPEAKETVIKKPPFIKLQGDGGTVALDTGSVDGSLIINESGLPGQARVVPIHEANDADIEKAGEMTNKILEEAAKERKLAIYMAGDQGVREKFIENTKDVEFLKQVATIEWQGDVAKLVREKLSVLGVGDE